MFEGLPSHWSTLKKLIWLKKAVLSAASWTYKTVTGSLIYILDALAAPVSALSVAINPVQSGSGDPAPDNVRPISGWTQAKIWRGATYDPTANPALTIDLDGTRYGGTLDVLTGVLTVNKAIITLNGTQNINTANWRPLTNTRAWNYLRTMTDNDWVPWQSIVPNIVCDSLPAVSYDAIYNTDSPGISTGNGTSPTVGLALRVADTTLTTKDAINAWLAQHPITVVYPMKTPVTVQLTPSTLSTLLGENNIWADTGDVTVTYRSN